MNEKEAREIIQEHKEGKCHECFEGECMDEAKGYLEALEKAKVLVEALRYAINYVYTAQRGARPIDRFKQVNKVKEALAQWEKEK